MDKGELEVLLGRQQRHTERYLGALKEDFDHKLDTVLEAVKDVPAIKEKIDLTFDKVGEIAVDVEVIKEAIKDHERRLQKVELV